jgi:hypothetical protein
LCRGGCCDGRCDRSQSRTHRRQLHRHTLNPLVIAG